MAERWLRVASQVLHTCHGRGPRTLRDNPPQISGPSRMS